MLESMEYDFNNYKEENLVPNIEKLQKRTLVLQRTGDVEALGKSPRRQR